MSFSSDSKILTKALSKFYSDSVTNKKPVINQERLDKIIKDLDLENLTRRGGLSGPVLEEFLSKYFSYSTRLHHPNYLGHQCAPPHYSSAFGSMINGFANNVSSIYEMSPVSVSIEYFLINWMLEKVGWEKAPTDVENYHSDFDFGGGVLVDGGSIANLTALIIARSKVAPEVWKEGNPPNLAILLPSESHYSLVKAAGVLGIGVDSIYYLEVDSRGAIIPNKIPKVYQKLIDDGKRPIALVANACSTAVGIYDPLDEIGDFCKEKGIWFHVDGAHGASALISSKFKHLLKGIVKADSLIWDAHKLLQTSSLCAALLVRNHEYMESGVQINQEASYLFHEKNQPGFDSIHRTIETTKSALGEKLFFTLGALGENGMAKYIDQQYELTLRAYQYLVGHRAFECAVKPESNILCFKVVGDDQIQLDIRNCLTMNGDFYITTVVFNSTRYLRLVFMSPHTTITTIEELVAEILKIKDLMVSESATNPS